MISHVVDLINHFTLKFDQLFNLIRSADVIETLKESGYNSTRILRENILSQSAMQKLRKGEMIGIKTLEQLY